MTSIMLIGRNQWIIDAAQDELAAPGLVVCGATSVDQTRAVLETTAVDHVFIGPGLPLALRLEVIAAVFTLSGTTTVHLKDHSTGPEGALAFVRAILEGLSTLDHAQESTSRPT